MKSTKFITVHNTGPLSLEPTTNRGLATRYPTCQTNDIRPCWQTWLLLLYRHKCQPYINDCCNCENLYRKQLFNNTSKLKKKWWPLLQSIFKVLILFNFKAQLSRQERFIYYWYTRTPIEPVSIKPQLKLLHHEKLTCKGLRSVPRSRFRSDEELTLSSSYWEWLSSSTRPISCTARGDKPCTHGSLTFQHETGR